MQSHTITRHGLSIVCLVGALLLTPAAALGQHANFVLFGDPTPEAAEIPKQQKHVHPLTAGYFHEDSFVTTDLRGWFIYHDFPKSSAIGGGSAKITAVQARVALTNTLQLVAYKDGYIDWDSGLIKDSGWNDIAAGLKWNFLQDWEDDLHAAVGAGYEFGTGSRATVNGDGEWRFWGSVDKGLDQLHLGATVNFFFSDQGDNFNLGQADRMSWHVRGDYFVCDWFSPVVEISGFHVTDEGLVVVPFQGLDVANLGGGKDEEVIVIGFGTEVRPADNIAARVAYETPLTKEDDLYGYRWTFSVIWSF